MELSGVGRLVQAQLLNTAKRSPDIEIGCYCLMPDHLHFILALSINTGRPGTSMVRFMQVFKSMTSRLYRQLRREGYDLPEMLLQRSYGDEVIADEVELFSFRRYIPDNAVAYQPGKMG
jgi:REP element-mobilizing transposase RayT